MIGIYDIEQIDSINQTLAIVRSNNERDTRCTFSTKEAVNDWDEIIIENDYGLRLFAGILETPTIDKTAGNTIYSVETRGYKKMFDRGKVEEIYEDELAGDIVRAIIADYAPDFDDTGVEDGITVEKVVYNYVLPSEGIQRIADAIGYNFSIDAYKTVFFSEKNGEIADQSITAAGDFFSNLRIIPDVSNLSNVVIVRGGTYLSEVITYEEVADGVKSKFVLPEKPHDVHVYVNHWNGSGYDGFVEATVGIQFGQTTALQEFQVNFNEKYIENGTHSLLVEKDILKVTYTYDVPIRVRVKNRASIAAMQLLYPDTDGEFLHVINDKTINTRDLAYKSANAYLDTYSNPIVSCTFNTFEDIYSSGQILPINVPEYVGSCLIQSITSRIQAGVRWQHAVSCQTTLYGFQEIMRDLFAANKIDLIDGETLETSSEFDDALSVSEALTVSVDLHRRTEAPAVSEDMFAGINDAPDFVYGPYFPADHADAGRVFILDGSPLG